jgi:hypothetical protein
MQYKSPIRFFEYCHIEISDPEALNGSRAKKQIAAEFNMEPSGIIRLDEIDYNKQDILSCLESPNMIVQLAFHQKIWAHKSLLHFLESGIVGEQFAADIDTVKEDIPFVGFCSPYFAPQFNKEMKQRLAKDDFDAAADWIVYCQMILLGDGETAFASTTSYLEQAIRLFRNLNKTTFLSRRDEVVAWTKNWARFINWLPDNLYSQKDDLAMVLINFCVEIQNADERTCFLISKQMIQLDYVDPSNARLIRENHEIYAEKVAGTTLNPEKKRAAPQKKSKPNYIWIILICVITFVRIMDKGCNNNRDRDNTHLIMSDEQIDALTTKLFFDKARNTDISESHSGMLQTMDSAIQTIPVYFSFFQPVDSSLETTLDIKNKTDSTIYLFLLDPDNRTLDITLAPNETLRLRKGDLAAIDFMVNAGSELKQSTLDSMECFYLNVKGDTALNIQYSDTATTYLDDKDYKRRVRLNITTRNGRFYASSPDKLDVYRDVIRIGGD